MLFVIVVGVFYVNPANWHPFAPYGLTGISFFGHTLFGQTGAGGEPLGHAGRARRSSSSPTSASTRSPPTPRRRRTRSGTCPSASSPRSSSAPSSTSRWRPSSPAWSPTTRSTSRRPVSDAFRQAGLPWARFLISVGAMAGITSVLLVMMLSQPRVWLAMARDGLVPRVFFGAVHEKYRTPWKATILTGVAGGHRRRPSCPCASWPTSRTSAPCSRSWWSARPSSSCACTHPEAERPFRAPFSARSSPILGILTCLILMFSLPPENW